MSRIHTIPGNQGPGPGVDPCQKRKSSIPDISIADAAYIAHEKKGQLDPAAASSTAESSDAERSPVIPVTSEDPDVFPDGGIKAWTVVFGAWCAIFCTFGVGHSIGVFQKYYVTEALSQYPASAVSWVTGVMLWTLNFTPVVFGFVYDKYGPRWIIIGGTVTYVFGMMMTSLATEYYQFFLAQSIVAGVGAGAAATVSMSAVISWFDRYRATAFGVMMSGSSVGGIVLPIMIPKLIDRVGFPWAMRVVGLLFLFMLSISCLTIRSRLPPRPKPFVLKEYGMSLREPAMAATVAAMFMIYWGMFLPYNFVILQAEAQGMSPDLVIYVLPIMHSVNILGRIIPGILADKFGRYNIMICITLIAAIFCLGLWIPGNTDATIIVFAVAFGFCAGGFTGLAPTLIAQISDIREIGIRNGSAFAIQSFGALTGSPIASAIVDSRGGDYLGLKLFCGLAILSASVVFVAARYVQVGFQWRKV
ncbi:MFS general substrate transporter [Sodiomyces alkalinus F11]|uniref:MFS general substrate transporter n=1 Tax=Sodiomyces alkalinus (strain CBS 110278 / VKM F-3762 / F11) TaxID=1314773 RepID=A0A3N2PKP6_SODAK|nr:MFS general substrate transporter [Sodiomyces alkalinus F11]ROT35098.1 MFS general substrate transporter [Sodiomyces alkalinus F11]